MKSESLLGYSFSNPALLKQALTHRSYGQPHNERLEFIGDGVLNFVVAFMLYREFPELPEGDLSRLRANLVNQQQLAALAQQIDLGSRILLGEGELKSSGHKRPSTLANALEAVFAAIFLDGGFAAAETSIRELFSPLVAQAGAEAPAKDAKTLLQEFLQSRRLALPLYSTVAVRGAAHEQMFEVECVIGHLKVRATGSGPSRKAAEQDAAGKAYSQATGLRTQD
ncbi:MAG: ribonuclease III [Burkholderiales bacterium]